MKLLTYLKICRVALVISTLLQVVAVSLPGWIILSAKSPDAADWAGVHVNQIYNVVPAEISVHSSVWYASVCVYHRKYNTDNDSRTPPVELNECGIHTYAMLENSDHESVWTFLSSCIAAASKGFFSVIQMQVELTVALFISLVMIGLLQFQLMARVEYERDPYNEPPQKAVFIAAIVLAVIELILIGLPTFMIFWTNVHILRRDYDKRGLTVGIPYSLVISFCAMLALVAAGECLEKLICRTEQPPIRSVSRVPESSEKLWAGSKHNSAAPDAVPLHTYAPSCLQYLHEPPPNQPMMEDKVDPVPYREYKMYPPK